MKAITTAAAPIALAITLALGGTAAWAGEHGKSAGKATADYAEARTAMSSMTTVVDQAAATQRLDTFAKAARKAGMKDMLTGQGPFTLLAPTDEAFAALPEGVLDDLMKPENREQLRELLSYHVIAGEVSATRAAELGSTRTLQGEDVDFTLRDGRLAAINDEARIVQANLRADNGLVHVIDRVILPDAVSEAIAAN